MKNTPVSQTRITETVTISRAEYEEYLEVKKQYYAKCWVRDNEGIWLYKSGSNLHVIEPISEYLVSQLAERICPCYVNYDLEFYHDKLVSKCALFTSEATGLAKASAVFHGKQPLPRLLNRFQDLDCDGAFRRMSVLDALTLNPDRHYGNFGFFLIM